MKAHTRLPLIICTFILTALVITSLAQASPALNALNITVTTNKQIYKPEETVQIRGNLTNGGSPVAGLVALQISNPLGVELIFRTLSTGSSSPTGNISIVSVIPCDSNGNPKSSFQKNTLAYFKVSVKNNGTTWESTKITLTTFDVNKRPFGIAAISLSLGPGINTWIQSIPVTDWTSTGTGVAYASVFTDWPQNGGVPYCSEASATYQIVSGTTSIASKEPTTESLMSTLGSYNTTFKLPPASKKGNYTIYVSSTYQGLHANKTTQFKLTLPSDANNDGKVNVYDLFILAKAWGSKVGDSNWDPRADFDGNGKVDTSDLYLLGRYWGQTA